MSKYMTVMVSAFRSVSCCFYTLSPPNPNSSTLISRNSSLKFINSLISSVPSLFLNVSGFLFWPRLGFPLRSLPPFQLLVWKLIFLMSSNSLQPVSLLFFKNPSFSEACCRALYLLFMLPQPLAPSLTTPPPLLETASTWWSNNQQSSTSDHSSSGPPHCLHPSHPFCCHSHQYPT